MPDNYTKPDAIQRIRRRLKRLSPTQRKLAKLNRRVDLIQGELDSLRESYQRLSFEARWYPPQKVMSYYANSQFDEDYRRWFIEKSCLQKLGYFPNLDEPKSFNEHTQWLKLNYHDPLITRCIDKSTFKDYVRETIGDGYTVPTLGVYKRAEDVDFDALPNSFVMKSTWGSGSRHVLIVPDKAEIMNKRQHLLMKANTWLQPWENVYYHTYDWGYRDIEPNLLIEEYIPEIAWEHKFYCFNGEPRFCIVSSHRRGQRRYRDFYSVPDWRRLSVKRHNENFPEPLNPPRRLQWMMEASRKLAAPFPHVRVDFSSTTKRTGGNVFVGELTFYSGSGTKPFDPPEGDFELGEYFELPTIETYPQGWQ